MSRMYNDYSSIARDREERNLNSVNFPEFHTEQKDSISTDENPEVREKSLKVAVLALAGYEKECSRVAAKILEGDLRKGSPKEKRTAEAVRLFVSVTELYAEIYVAKDLTNRVK